VNGTRTPSAGDWMDMTLSDWLEVTPSEWMDRAVPGWREGYGGMMGTTPRDWMSRMYAPLATPTSWPTMQPAAPGREGRRDRPYGDREGRRHRPYEGRERKHHHRHDCRCRDCGPDPCECYCCIGDVDVVVYTRVGERRVVPITIENERRREREIKLELSSWTTRGGKEELVHGVVAPTEFTLPPCGAQEVTLLLDVRGEQPHPEASAVTYDTVAPEVMEATDVEATNLERRRLPDVDGCQVVTADLRLIGCDHRSLRIAAAILPRDCDPFRVSCGCTCC